MYRPSAPDERAPFWIRLQEFMGRLTRRSAWNYLVGDFSVVACFPTLHGPNYVNPGEAAARLERAAHLPLRGLIYFDVR